MHNQAQLGVDFLNYTDKSMIASKIDLWNKKRWKEWENNTLTLKEYILALWFLSKLNNTKKKIKIMLFKYIYLFFDHSWKQQAQREPMLRTSSSQWKMNKGQQKPYTRSSTYWTNLHSVYLGCISYDMWKQRLLWSGRLV